MEPRLRTVAWSAAIRLMHLFPFYPGLRCYSLVFRGSPVVGWRGVSVDLRFGFIITLGGCLASKGLAAKVIGWRVVLGACGID